MTYICAIEYVHHWFILWVIAYSRTKAADIRRKMLGIFFSSQYAKFDEKDNGQKGNYKGVIM